MSKAFSLSIGPMSLACSTLCRTCFRHIQFPPPTIGVNLEQKRYRYGPAASPKLRELTRRGVKEKQYYDHEFSARVEEAISGDISRDSVARSANVSYEMLISFLRRAVQLSDAGGADGPFRPAVFRELLAAYPQLIHWVGDHNTLWNLTYHLCRLPSDYPHRYKKAGFRLLYSLSEAGALTAHKFILLEHVLGKGGAKALQVTNVKNVRKRLQQFIATDGHFSAKILEAKLMALEDRVPDAIKLLESTLEQAAASTRSERIKAELKSDGTIERDYMELTSPWIELAELYNILHRQTAPGPARDQTWKRLLEVLDVGMNAGDPQAYFLAAKAAQRDFASQFPNQHPDQVKKSSKWLLYISKAAASGMPVAAHELGEFYASSPWKFLGDEPPGYFKPTPFDEYPPSGAQKEDPTGQYTLSRRLQRALGIGGEPLIPGHMFVTAAYPSTPSDRYRLAAEWFNVATQSMYAPSHLYLARMYLERDISANLAAPRSATRLQKSRYLYRSHDDYADAKFEGRLVEDTTSKDTMVNPLHNYELAVQHLREVVFATDAARHRRKGNAKINAPGAAQRGGMNLREFRMAADDTVDFETTRDAQIMPEYLQKWWRARDVFELWSPDSEHYRAGALGMCDQFGLDLYDDQNRLIYLYDRKIRAKTLSSGEKDG